MIELQAGDAEAVVDPDLGGRVTSLRVGGHELLAALPDPRCSGCYPMVPWAGRVRDGRFTFRGRTHELPLDAPPHAIHGFGHQQPWEVVAPDEIELDLGGHWSLGGTAGQTFALTPTELRLTMTVTAGERAMPVVAGWHPCFRRRLDVGEDARLAFTPTAMWARDEVAIPTGELVPVPDGPWDDAFAGVDAPSITWPGALSVTLRSGCPAWVVYDQDPRVVCVEPQSDAPDAFNRDPDVLEAGESMTLDLSISWITEPRSN